MWTELIKAAGKWQVHGIIAISGATLVYLSMFTGFPTSANGWSPNLRASSHLELLATGIFFIILAVGLAAILSRNNQEPRHESIGLPDVAKVEAPIVNHAALIPESEQRAASSVFEEEIDHSGNPAEHPIVVRWWKLPKTQKEIVVFLYEHSHKSRVGMDEFFKGLIGEHGPKLVNSEDELFYRLKSLRYEGFLEMSAIAPQSTDIVKLDSVRRALSKADVINT